MSRVVVTGSSGQVGSYVVDALRERGRHVLGIDRRPSPWTTRVADVRDVRHVPDTDAVVHCAAQVSVPRSVEDPRMDAAHNVDGTLAMLELARRADASRFVFVSSAAVYGDVPTVPVGEDAPRRPRTPYGLSKAVGEGYVDLYRELYGLPVVVLRPFNIFSRRQDPESPYSGVITRFAATVAAGSTPTVDGDGEATRDFVHATDVVAAVRLALDHPGAVGGTFNVGTGRATRIRDLACLVARLAGRRPDLEHGPPRPGDIRHSVADVTRLTSLGYTSMTDLYTHLVEVLSSTRDRRTSSAPGTAARQERADALAASRRTT